MDTLKGLIVVVTGAGRGVGKAIALEAAAHGASVACLARSSDEIQATADEIEQSGGTAIAVTTDICDATATEHAAQTVQDRLGPADVLINNAGSFYGLGPVHTVDPQVWWQDIAINLQGTFLASRAFLPHMLDRDSGIIITMSGGGAGNPLPNGSGYASSKAAVLRFTECLAAELVDTNVYAYTMSPGFVRTRLTEHHVFSEDGRRYLPSMKHHFDGDKEYPPDKAAALAVRLCRLRCRALSGRLIGLSDDVDALEAAADVIADSNGGTLRVVPFTERPQDIR